MAQIASDDIQAKAIQTLNDHRPSIAKRSEAIRSKPSHCITSHTLA